MSCQLTQVLSVLLAVSTAQAADAPRREEIRQTAAPRAVTAHAPSSATESRQRTLSGSDTSSALPERQQ